MGAPSPGIYRGIPDTEYHGWDALGSTSVKTLATKPAGVFLYQQENPRESSSFAIGTAAHALILEGREDAFTIVDAPDWRSKTAREARVNGPALLTGEWDQVRRMRDSVMSNPDAAALLTNHEPEVSIRWDDITACKGRLDAWHEVHRIVVDLKTCADASPDGFQRAAWNYGYGIQAGYYLEGLNMLTGDANDYYIVAVEKDGPHMSAVYQLSPDLIDRGREAAIEGLRNYEKAVANNDWPTIYPTSILEPPRWA